MNWCNILIFVECPLLILTVCIIILSSFVDALRTGLSTTCSFVYLGYGINNVTISFFDFSFPYFSLVHLSYKIQAV